MDITDSKIFVDAWCGVIAKRLDDVAYDKRLKYRAIAQGIGADPSTVSKALGKGQAHIKVFLSIAVFLEVDAQTLFHEAMNTVFNEWGAQCAPSI